MRNIEVNAKNRTIVITKAFAKAASNPCTEEYDLLQKVRRDYPNFKVVVKATKQKKETTKGLTYEYMEKYIEAHDTDEKEIMAEYRVLRGLDDDLAESMSYAEIKGWFFDTFPAVADFHKKREEILARAAQRKEKAAKKVADTEEVVNEAA